MRKSWIAAFSMAVALMLSAPSRSENATADVGSFLVVRGRLAECKTWPNRVLTVKEVPEDGNVKLLGLGPFPVLGRTGAELTGSLVAAYAERLPDRESPPARVLILSGPPTGAFIGEALFSLQQIASHSCPQGGDPKILPFLSPEPNSPEPVGPGDFPTFEDIERLVAELEARLSASFAPSPPPNNGLQLTPASQLQMIRGSVLASGICPSVGGQPVWRS